MYKGVGGGQLCCNDWMGLKDITLLNMLRIRHQLEYMHVYNNDIAITIQYISLHYTTMCPFGQS